MKEQAEATAMTLRRAAFESEHARTHRRWVRTVLALYGLIVSIGIIATLVHGSMIQGSKPAAMQLQAKAQISG